jgi:hypothetical protein
MTLRSVHVKQTELDSALNYLIVASLPFWTFEDHHIRNFREIQTPGHELIQPTMFTDPTPQPPSASWKITVKRLLVTFKSLGCPINPLVVRERHFITAFEELCFAQTRRYRRQLNTMALYTRLGTYKAFMSAQAIDRTFALESPQSMVALLAFVYFTNLAVTNLLPIPSGVQTD